MVRLCTYSKRKSKQRAQTLPSNFTALNTFKKNQRNVLKKLGGVCRPQQLPYRLGCVSNIIIAVMNRCLCLFIYNDNYILISYKATCGCSCASGLLQSQELSQQHRNRLHLQLLCLSS
jgi:hypothetical protein